MHLSTRTLSLIVITLCAVLAVTGLYMSQTPEGSESMSAIAQGPPSEAREYIMYVIIAALVGFIGYLTMTRR